MEQARRDASRKSRAEAGQDRNATPERIARSGVGIVWKRVEKQIRQAFACPMVPWILQEGREHESVSRDATSLGLSSQIAPDGRIDFGEPEHAALHLL